jgi:hypothetical protein
MPIDMRELPISLWKRKVAATAAGIILSIAAQCILPTAADAAGVVSVSPPNQAQGVAIGSILRFEFDAPVSRGSGSIVVARQSNGANVVEEFGTNSPNSRISGNVLMLRMTPNLYVRNTLYYVIFRPNAITYNDGNSFSGGVQSSFRTFAGNSDKRFLYDYSTGSYTIDFYNRDDTAKNGLLSADASKLFVQGTNTSTTGNKTYVAQASLINSNGILALNSQFGTTLDRASNQGVSEEVLDGSSNEQQFLSAAIDREERLILAGKVSSAGADSLGYFVTRFDKFGRIDKSFQPTYGGKRQYDLTNGPDVAWSVIIQQQDNAVANDKYVIGGTVSNSTSVGFFRLMSSGDPDPTFGTPKSWTQVSNGIELTDQSLYNSSSFVFSKPPSMTTSGDLLITGSGLEGGQHVFRTYSFSASGFINTGTFGNSTGQAITNFNPYNSDRATAAMNYCINLPAPCSHAAGANENRTLVGGTVSLSANPSRWALARLDESGTIDTDWGNNGNDFQVLNNFDSSKSVTFVDFGVQKDGKVVVLGYVMETISGQPVIYPKLERYNRDGSVDRTFGSNGNLLLKSKNNVTPYKLSLSGDHLFVTATTETDSRGKDFAVFVRDKDGKELFSEASGGQTLSISSMSPDSGATNVSPRTDISLTYSGVVQRGSGTIELRRGTATGSILETLQVSDTAKVTYSNKSLILNPAAVLPLATKIFVRISPGAVLDLDRSSAETPVNYSFTTASSEGDRSRPKVKDFSFGKSAIVFTFNENIKRGSGSLTLYGPNASGKYGAIPFSETVAGKVLTLKPNKTLISGQSYKVKFLKSTITDLAGNDLLAPNQSSWSFSSSIY